MADLGSELWKHSDDGMNVAIRLVTIKYTARCESAPLSGRGEAKTQSEAFTEKA